MTDHVELVEPPGAVLPEGFAALSPPGQRLPPWEAPGHADALLTAYRKGVPAARCTLSYRSDLVDAPGRSALVGHFECTGEEAGVALLHRAVAHAREVGCRRVLGPMNGGTWFRYRFALPPEHPAEAEPPFAGEPVNPAHYPAAWDRAGLARVAAYESALVTDLSAFAVPPDASVLEGHGLRVATLDPGRYDETIREVYPLCLESFADNRYYAPIDAETFEAMYRGLRGLLDPELVYLVYDATDRLVATLFAYPDPLAPPGNPRLVTKTIATHPDVRRLGVGTALLDRLHHEAFRRGVAGVLHALMHTSNASKRMSERLGGRTFRRYALWGLEG